ncbi:glycoside hydrolase family 32 protein [Paenibacillus sedimenti]|uniref:Glycoside hydrolase family 32 protein n=1 Tax=Paenibacillus sedimenti TaxID=2770274 RepID=A0A926KQ82_9BACL|nr:glycoside hydrolase family 32 protein [Paenibacillus sedimenti]MBD0380219.1 glycoside hydrolase family 32 protein [Paenibacillus sedimenti]
MTTANYQERFRPQLHFTPAKQWMNDPNGMVFYEGEYHLCYQYHPESTVWGPMHWGHAVSRDLIHWEHLPIALEPDQHGTIFSGSIVADECDTSGFFGGGSGLVAIFTHHDTMPGTEIARQRQSLAYSVDRGRTWLKYANNPVLAEEHLTDFRDPKVFWYEDGHNWVMVIAAGDHIRFYTSPNLKEWEYSGEFGADQGSHTGVWECPDLFPLPVDGMASTQKWVLIVSIGDDAKYAEGSRTQYFIGHFDGYTFVAGETPAPIRWLDHGRDNYAGVTWSDVPEHDGRRLFIGWMSNWKYALVTPTSQWRSAMTLPRELSLGMDAGEIYLRQIPVKELCVQRGRSKCFASLVVSSGQEQDLGEGDLLEIIAEFEVGDALEFGLKVRTSDKEETIIGYDSSQHRLFIDRTKSGMTDFHDEFACKHSALLSPIHGMIKLHIFVDWSSIEVFANDGRLVMTDLIFPEPSSRGLKLFAKEGSVKVKSVAVYELDSIYAGQPSTVSHS